MPALLAFVIGLVFGIGLLVSGMFDPGKVQAFLDLAGRWDPSLAIVMGVAVPIAALANVLARRRGAPLVAPAFNGPTARDVDARLVLGSVTFGVGWGLAGICPAPALLLASSSYRDGIVFVVAMLLGMLVFDWIEHYRTATRPRPSPDLA